MGRNVFVSYKYMDQQVQKLQDRYYDDVNGVKQWINRATRCRDYVDDIMTTLTADDHVYVGEKDGESLEDFARGTIGSKLADKLFRSSVTIVLISKGMKDPVKQEQHQWIPWEISYSLKEQTREDQKSRTNGVLAVVVPDEMGSYEYYITRNEPCNCRTLNTPFLFQILAENMFNVKQPNCRECNGSLIYYGDYSYIQSVKWIDFKAEPSKYIDKAIELRDRKDEFNLRKNIN